MKKVSKFRGKCDMVVSTSLLNSTQNLYDGIPWKVQVMLTPHDGYIYSSSSCSDIQQDIYQL